MITAEPVDFFPRGRGLVEEHPGPLIFKQQINVSGENLLYRMQNVNISSDNNILQDESWMIREVFTDCSGEEHTGPKKKPEHSDNDPASINDYFINTEEEIYFKKNTAVWSKGVKQNGDVQQAVLFTSDSPIKFAFFCSNSFLDTSKNVTTICVIDSSCIRFYCDNGEDFISNLEFPVSQVWNSQIGIILEKEASNAIIQNHSISMPRIFSLSHPMHDIAPILSKTSFGAISYLTENEYRVIFISDESELVLMYDNKVGKHFIAKLRKATEDEVNFVGCCQDQNSTMNQSNNSYKWGGKNSTTYMTRTSLGAFLNATNPHAVSFGGNQTNFYSPLNQLQSSFGRQSASIQEMRRMIRVQPAKPIKPEYLLEHIWMESALNKDFCEISSKGFLHTDLVENNYLCYVLPRTMTLQFVPLEKTSNGISFGKISSVQAKDAVCLKKMKMIALLDPMGTIMMYSGPNLLSKIHISGNVPLPVTKRLTLNSPFPRRSSLLPSAKHTESPFNELHALSPVHPLQPLCSKRMDGTQCLSLRDPAGNRISLVYPDGRISRISVPLINETYLVKKCLRALRKIINNDDYVHFVSKFYGSRNAPGTNDLTLGKEWEIFKTTLSEFLGRHNSPLNESITVEEPKTNKKRKTDEEEDKGCEEDWENLASIIPSSKSEFLRVKDLSDNREVDPSTPLFHQIPLVFFTFHLLYEDLKIHYVVHDHSIKCLGEFLFQLAFDMRLNNYCYSYVMDFPHLSKYSSNPCFTESNGQMMQNKELLLNRPVPNIFHTIKCIINGRDETKYPCIEEVNTNSRNVIQLMALVFHGVSHIKTWVDDLKYGSEPAKKTRRMIKRNASKRKQIIQMLVHMNMTREDVTRLPLAIHLIIADVLETSRISPPIGASAETYDLIVRPDLVEHTKFDSLDESKSKFNRSYVDSEDSLSMRTPPAPHFPSKNEALQNDDDGMEYVDTKLLSLRFPDDLRIKEVRRLLNSADPVLVKITQSAGVSDHEFLEEQEKHLYSISLRTMTLPIGRGMFTLRTCIPTPTDTLPVPKLCLIGKEPTKGATIEMTPADYPPNMSMWPKFHNGVAAGLRVSPSATDIDSTWIVYNKPKGSTENSTEHAGFLMALGLNGHLKNLSFMGIYEYLIKCEELTSVGLMLGISATYRGTMDNKTTKMLSVHIEALLPSTTLELDISQNIQIASLMGIGLVYQGSAKRHIAEVLLQEIGRPPGPEMENSNERESYALTSGLALGLVTLGQGESPAGLRDLQLPDMLHYYMVGGNKRPLTGSQKEKYKLPSFQVREGDTVNVDVTAPGATLALGLMFFNTGNRDVADWMKPPDTSYLLDLIRPDLLLLRVIARGLILWSDIRSNSEWLFGQFPASLRFDLKRGPPPSFFGPEIDHEANAQAYCNIISGAAFCVGLKYAGTKNEEAYKTLRRTIKLFLSMNGQYVGEYAGKTTVENCLILAIISISLVYAGTGDLQILRIIRYLRSRVGPNNSHITYGSHMGITMALGFLFLSCGRYSISRSPEAIAALVISLFPKFPNHSNDNRYHLQAFRHLYILAVEPRIFLPRDIDTKKLCLADISYMTLNSNKFKKIMAPCILPELNTLKTVVINDKSHWSVSFERNRNWDQLKKILENCGCVDIKKRTGCLSYSDDPYRLKSLLAQTITEQEYNCWHIDNKSLLAFSSDPKVICFADKLVNEETLKTENRLPILMLIFYTCLTKDRMHASNIYYSLIDVVEKPVWNSFDVWQIKLIEMFMDHPGTKALVSPEIICSILSKIESSLKQKHFEFVKEIKHFISTECYNFVNEMSDHQSRNFFGVVNYYDLVPNCINLVDLSGKVNFIRLLYEFKKINFTTKTVKCIGDIIKMSK